MKFRSFHLEAVKLRNLPFSFDKATVRRIKRLFLTVSFVAFSLQIVSALDLDRKADSTALFTLYTNAGGSGWVNKSGWLTSYITSWYGVTTSTINGHVRVTGLSLPNNNLTGTLIISNLSELQVLDVRNNPLPGGSSDYSQNLKLKFIDASNTNMGMPSGIVNLSQLESLNLNGNNITQVGGGGSSLPSGLTSLTKLTFLQLGSNKFTGSIPATIGNLVNLTFLDLGNNLLTGSIPTGIGSLTKLEYLYLGVNQLSGSIPTQIGNLTDLKYLWLAGNQLTGSIPTQIGNLTALTSIWLGGNQLSGNIPTTIGNLVNVEDLHLDNNLLSGSIPSQLGALTNLKILFLWTNQLSGSIPSFLGNLTSLEQLALDVNQFTGAVPVELNNLVNLKFINIGANQLTGTLPTNFLSNATQLEQLKIWSTNLTGAIPISCLSSPNLFWAPLHDNAFDGLPNISALPIFSKANGKVEVQGNKLTFEDIEPNRNIAASKFVYVPQQEITTAPVTILANQLLSLSFSIGGSANVYQWQKNSVNIPGANSNSYAKTAALSDGGNYTLVVTNSLVPSLNIKRNITVTVLPANDYCSSATSIAIPSNTTDTTAPATSDAAPNCGDAVDGTGGGVWYSVIGNGKTITARLCNGTNYDTQLRVFSGSCGSLVCVAGNDDSCGTASKVSWDSANGTTFFILVHGYGTETGTFQLELSDKIDQTISFSQPPPFLTTSLPSNVLGQIAGTSSGLPLTFSSSNTSVATVTNGILTFTGAGTTDITATQVGNSDYLAAIQVVRTVTVLDGTTSPFGYYKSAGVAITDAQFAYPTSLDYDANGNLYVLDGGKVKVYNSSGVFIRAIGGLVSQGGIFSSPNDFEVASNGNVYVLDIGKKGIHVFNATGDYLKFFGFLQSGDNQSSVFAFIDSDETNSHIFVSDGRNHSIKEFDADGNFITKWGTQGSADGQLNAPRGIKVKNGKVYVTELSNSRVSVFTTAGVFVSKFSTDIGTINGTSSSSPRHIEVDASGNIYISTLGYLTILKFDGAGNFVDDFGTFGWPNGLAINPSGNILASDQNAGTIQVFTPAGVISQTIFALTPGQLSSPNGMAFDAANQKFYVSDASHRIQSFDTQGNFLSQFGGYGSGNSQFKYPGGMAVDAAGQLYVADAQNSRVQVFSSAGAFVKTISIAPDANVASPSDVALDGNGNVYVTDSNNNRVLIYDSQGVFQTEFGTSGSGDGQFSGPNGIALAANGDIIVVDQFNNRIQVFSSAGAFKAKGGILGRGAGHFVSPYGIAIDALGNVYVSELSNSRIQVFNSAGVYQYTIGSYGSGATEIRSPRGISISPDGILWVADGGNNRVQAFGLPNINVKVNTTSIATSGTYGFGNVNMLANSGAITFTIENIGVAPLSLSGSPKVSVSGANASDFVVNAASTTASVAATASTTFVVTFTPGMAGARVAQLSIANNDPDETPYLINLTGTGVKLNQTITFGALASKLTSDPTFTLGASSTSALAVSYLSSDVSVATVNGNTVTIIGVGTTTITASQAGDVNYIEATAVPQNLAITIGNQSITFDPLPSKAFGDPAFALGATSSAGLAITYTSSNTSVATVTGSTVTLVGVGTTTITASQAGDGNYNAATPVEQILTVLKDNQTITFDVLTSKLVSDPTFTLGASSSSGLAISYASSNGSVATVSGSIVTIIGVGSTNITASQAGNSNYNAAIDVIQALTVEKANQTISFDVLSPKVATDVAFDLSATSSSGLAVSYISSNTAVATINGKTVTIVGAGSTTITANQAGDATFNAATDVTQTLIITKATQTITFPVIADKTLGGAAFALTAAASSALSVSYATTSDKITISSSQVTLVKAGRATITASQAGNTTFNAAASVDQSFCIKPAKPTITVSGANTDAVTLASSASAGNQWFKDGVAIAGATSATLSVITGGVYKVQVKVDDCLSEFSADAPFIITGDINAASNGITFYPNPVEDFLEIRGLKGMVSGSQIFDATGRTNSVILEKQVNDNHRANVQHLSQGVYLLRVQLGNAIHQIKFIKK